jgi:hypothetical protein
MQATHRAIRVFRKGSGAMRLALRLAKRKAEEKLAREVAKYKARILELENEIVGPKTTKSKSEVKPARVLKRKRSAPSVAPNPTQHQFSNNPKKLVKTIIPDFPNDYRGLDSFGLKKSGSVSNNHAHSIAGALAIIKAAFGLCDLNEAGRSMYIAPVLCLGAISLKKTATVAPQYKLYHSRVGSGAADYVIKSGNKIRLVIEAKTNDLTVGVAQNALQLFAAYHENVKNNCLGAEESQEIYGLVTTGYKSVFTKLEFINGKPQLKRSDECLSLPLDRPEMSTKELRMDVQALTECLIWAMSQKESC